MSSRISRQVAALVKAGLIERQADPEDGRASLLAVCVPLRHADCETLALHVRIWLGDSQSSRNVHIVRAAHVQQHFRLSVMQPRIGT